MEKIIRIEDKDVKFRADGSIGRIYRAAFGSDIFEDNFKMYENIKNDVDFESVKNKNADEIIAEFSEMRNEKQHEIIKKINVDILENVAWCMAKCADNTIPEIYTWLGGFKNMTSLHIALNEIMEFFSESQKTRITPKK